MSGTSGFYAGGQYIPPSPDLSSSVVTHQPMGESSYGSPREPANVSSILGRFSPDALDRLLDMPGSDAAVQTDVMEPDRRELSYSVQTQTHVRVRSARVQVTPPSPQLAERAVQVGDHVN